ncbi:MAG TPA: fatty acid desaturase [Xanthobacteraceae bacterium]
MHGNLADKARPNPGELPLPAMVPPIRIAWPYAIGVVAYHLVALLAFVPWFFSWSGVVLALLGLYVFGTLGINLCYHRLLTHRGLVTPKPLEHLLAVLGVCCFQETPARWVAVHRRHHQHADEQPDPHSPLVNFFWGHMGWIMVENDELNRLGIFERYSKDVLRDKFYVKLERNNWWVWVLVISWAVFFLAGFAAELIRGGGTTSALQFGASVLVWGVFVRTVLVWHITWSVNSVTHRWGYRNYETDEGSRNNILIGLISNGEGWHNNHHADPRSAKHGHKWWELDVTWLTVKLLMMVGLAKNVAVPSPHIAAAFADGKLATHDFSVTPKE